jgi:hypothetical protein
MAVFRGFAVVISGMADRWVMQELIFWLSTVFLPQLRVV